MWLIRKQLIKLLAGKQAVMLNTTVTFAHKDYNKGDIQLRKQVHQKYIFIDNLFIENDLSNNKRSFKYVL